MNIKNKFKLFKFLVKHGKTIAGFTKKPIGYIGWVGHNNLGDEAMFLAFKNLFYKYHIFPYNTIKEYPRIENRLRSKELEAIALGGGTLLNSPGSLKNFISVFKYYPDSTIFTFGTGVKNPLYWNNIEDWQDDLKIWIKYLKKCEYVSVRGPLSKKLLIDKGLNKVEIIGDLALTLAKDEIIEKKKNKQLGLNVGTSYDKIWGNEKQFLNDIAKLVNLLLKKNWNVTLLSVWDKDETYLKKLLNKIDKPLKIFHGYKSISNTLKFLSECDIVIGEKLHSVIMANCVHTPAIMLEYRPKCLDYMLSMDLERFVVRTDRVKNELIINLLDELYGNLEIYQSFIKEQVDYYKNLQFKAAQKIKKLLK